MLNLLMALWLAWKDYVSNTAENAATALSERQWPDFFKALGLMSVALLAPVGGIAILFLVAYRWRKALLVMVVCPILLKYSKRIDERGGRGTPCNDGPQAAPLKNEFIKKLAHRHQDTRSISHPYGVPPSAMEGTQQ